MSNLPDSALAHHAGSCAPCNGSGRDFGDVSEDQSPEAISEQIESAPACQTCGGSGRKGTSG